MTLCGALLVLEDISRQVDFHFFTFCFAPLIWLFLLVDYILRFPKEPVPDAARNEPGSMPGSAWYWLILPILAVVITILVLDDRSRGVAMVCGLVLLVLVIGLLLLWDHVSRFPADSMPDTGRRRGRWRWLVLPVAFTMTLSALLYPWPMLLRFSLSRSAFEQKVAEMPPAYSEQGPQRIGLYWVSRIEAMSDGSVKFVTGATLDEVGFAYRPWNPPSYPLRKHVVGSWYAEEW